MRWVTYMVEHLALFFCSNNHVYSTFSDHKHVRVHECQGVGSLAASWADCIQITQKQVYFSFRPRWAMFDLLLEDFCVTQAAEDAERFRCDPGIYWVVWFVCLAMLLKFISAYRVEVYFWLIQPVWVFHGSCINRRLDLKKTYFSPEFSLLSSLMW